jgi:hypothetical protein
MQSVHMTEIVLLWLECNWCLDNITVSSNRN